MNNKFNKFQNLFETAFSHFSNGGFREGTPVVLKPSFLKCGYFKKHYSGHEAFSNFLKELIDNGVMFFIKRVVGRGSLQNVKDANDNEGAGDVYLSLHTDPRTVQWPTEYNEFTIPGDFDLLDIKDYGINLPPVQGVPNRYELPLHSDIKVFKMETKVDNRPEDDFLPTKNTTLAHTSKPGAPKLVKITTKKK